MIIIGPDLPHCLVCLMRHWHNWEDERLWKMALRVYANQKLILNTLDSLTSHNFPLTSLIAHLLIRCTAETKSNKLCQCQTFQDSIKKAAGVLRCNCVWLYHHKMWLKSAVRSCSKSSVTLQRLCIELRAFWNLINFIGALRRLITLSPLRTPRLT